MERVEPTFGSSTVGGVLHLSPPAEFGERRSDPKCGSRVWARTG